MKQVKITLERTKDGYSAYAENVEGVYGGGDTAEEAKQSERDLMKVLAEKYISYGEYITIEFNTEDQSARALPAK